MEVHKERKHAVLSASGSHRWIECTASARLEELFPDVDTSYSMEGTRAHEIAEEYLSYYVLLGKPISLEFDTYEDRVIADELVPYLNEIYRLFELRKEEYADAELLLEQRLDFSNYVPEGFGTGDVVMIYGDTIEIIDLKFGKGVRVDATENSQMKLYALGAYNIFGEVYDFKQIVMRILQPRLDHGSTDYLSVEELLQWAETEVKHKAEEAFHGKGEFIPGEHCRFCKAAGMCKARMEETMELAELVKLESADLMSPEDMATVLNVSDKLTAFVKAVNDRAISLMLSGVNIPGYKVVEGRTLRKVTDQDGLVKALVEEGINEHILFERKMLGISKLQTIVGKKKFDLIAEPFLTKPEGAPTIAPESDKRPALNGSALDDFNGIDDL